VSETKPEAEAGPEVETSGGLTDEEEALLDALDEVEQTIDAMSSVLASLRERLADHLQGRSAGPTAVLEDWPENEPHLH
jgi:ABC-type Fe3+-hydroxamate transport system substrate-binding protein